MCCGGSLLIFSHLHDVANCVLEIIETETFILLKAVRHA